MIIINLFFCILLGFTPEVKLWYIGFNKNNEFSQVICHIITIIEVSQLVHSVIHAQ